MPMGSAFQRDDPVRWNSEAGRVAGRVVRAHARGMLYQHDRRRCGGDRPQPAIRSDRGATHRGTTPEKIG